MKSKVESRSWRDYLQKDALAFFRGHELPSKKKKGMIGQYITLTHSARTQQRTYRRMVW
jgi:hypothetical protein